MRYRKVYKPILSSLPLMKKRTSVFVRRGKRKTDFSNRTVLIVLLLLVVVSIVSIGVYLQTLNSVKPKFVVNEGKAVGEVMITITKPPNELGVLPDENNLNSQP